MLDVTSVGANLSPEQQEATLADLTFFLDSYGSTHAVRFKLKAQQREIQRLMDQLQQLLNGREGEELRDDERQVATNGELFEDDMGGVDETMVDVDFFLRVYGSTQAVRQELSSQRNKIEILSKTIANFEKQQEQQDVNVSETQGCKGVGGNSDFGEENEVQVESAGVVTQESKEHANDSSQSRSVDCRRLSHVTCRTLGCMKWVKRNGDTSEYCTVHRGVTTASQDGSLVQNESAREEESSRGGRCDHDDSQTKVIPVQSPKELTAADSKETPHEFMGFVAHPVWLLNVNTVAYYQKLRSSLTAIPSTSSSNQNSELREPTTSHVESTGNSSTATKQTNSVRENWPSPRVCRHPECNKNAQVHGLCCAHGGYNICKVDGCDRRVISRKLCRYHGGCPRCKMSGCEKITSSIGKGYCYRHAREQGILGKQSNRSRVEKTGDSGNRVVESQMQAKPDRDLQAQFFKNFLDNGENVPISNRENHLPDPRESHTVCKVLKCMKWAKRDGDQSEYCFLHKYIASEDTAQDPSASSTQSEAEANVAEVMTDNSNKHRHSMCNEVGCEGG
ncbi:hypothetical protein P3T76_007979 [Phytophthora citrophthora]|uniref:Uncharacterized protein n=1 Tax=Phytophthora citrophthora TaxID=4793 RepID=A0AAD9GLP3_9STRA|nr:hypothetical protein P3T76_007979 [Phytophthora citrophthora]